MGAKTLLSLNQGELVSTPPASLIQVRIVRRINLILSRFVNERSMGEVYSEAGYLLFRDPEKTFRQPDVSFLSKGRVEAMPDATFLEGAPELAIEVISPGRDAQDLDLKLEQYLAAGSREVWVVYPKTRSVQIYKTGGRVAKASDSDIITSDLFPGWSARVADFFDLDY